MRASRLLRPILAALVVGLAACSEEDRRAWVSILPNSGDEEEADADGGAGDGFGLGADSTAVLLDGDTLFTIERLPGRGASARLAEAVLAPDSARVAFRMAGSDPALGVWTRARQSARLVAGPAGGTVERIEWAPGGRFLAWQGRTADGLTMVGVYDAGLGREMRQHVLSWLARQGRSAWLQDWIDADRLRVLVGPGAAVEGGLAHVWDPRSGAFLYEAHLEPLAERAPAGSALSPGGVFSLDLLEDPAPETVALYRTPDGAPAGLVLLGRGSEYRAMPTEPLIDLAQTGAQAWKQFDRGAALHQIVDLGGRPTLVLDLPFGTPSGRLLGLYQVRPDGRLEVLQADEVTGPRPAVFTKGRAVEGQVELGILDLDGDGIREVVSAVGAAGADGAVEWRAAVYRFRAGRLVPAPDLEPEAVAAIGRLTAE